jgi:hypothetical protein
MEPEKFKKLLTLIMNAFRTLEREMLAQTAVLAVLKTQYGIGAEIDQMLESARGLDAIEKQLQDKYDKPTQAIFQAIDSTELQNQLLKILQEWTPKGPPS